MKAGVIGNGYWGKILADKVRNSFEIIDIQDSKSVDLNVLIDSDWVFIATPVSTHFTLCYDALNLGLNVFVEKPFCTNVREAVELIELARKKKLNLVVDNVFLRRSEYLEYREVLQNEDYIKFVWEKNGPYRASIVDDLLYHDLYILIDLFGLNLVSDFKCKIHTGDLLIISFNFGSIRVEIDYNRNHKYKRKCIISKDNAIVFSDSNQDPLDLIVRDLVVEDSLLKTNEFSNLLTMILFSTIKSMLES